MEDAHFEASRSRLVQPEFSFPRSHLRSRTYRTLLRILSPFCDDADVSLATEFDPQELRAAYSSQLRQVTVEPSGQQVGEDFVRVETRELATEKVTVVEDGLGINSLEDGCFHDSEVKMDVVNDTTTVERSGNASDERKFSGASSRGNHCVHEQNNREELEAEHIVEGNKVPIDDNKSDNTRASDQKSGGNDQIFQEESYDHQQVMAEEDVTVVQKLSGTIISLEGNSIGEASKPEDNQENRILMVGNHTHECPENQPKESESERIVPKPDLEGSHVSSFDVMEVEDGEKCSEKVSEKDPSYLDKEIPCKAYEQSKTSDDKAISMVVDVSKVKHKMPSKDMQMDKCTNENEDIEEGEICGDFSTHEILEDPEVLAEKVVDIQISEDIINRNKLPSNESNGVTKKPASFSDTAKYASHENKEESEQNKSSMEEQNKSSMEAAYIRGSFVSEKMVTSTNEGQNDFMLEERRYKVKHSGAKKAIESFIARVSNQVLCNQVPSERASGQKKIVSTEMETGACDKKKRGPLSEGRKERKKILKRKKRAEKNRKLGVKRMKLHPVTVPKPKPVVYCRHYINGKCQEGDKCKFSHDTIPKTKSTPCSYFARHSCMKGDDCPFDHQLSKYPCSNFVSKGSCPRGDTCMFSHKVLPLEESSSMSNLKTEPKPLQILDILDSQKKLNISGTSCNRTPLGGTSTKKTTGPPVGINFQKTTGPPPVGINFLSFGKSPVCPSKTQPYHSSQVKNDDVEGGNALNRIGNSVEISRKIQPETASKGINFLSFGKTSLKSNSEKLATPSSYNDATIPSGNQIEVASKTGHDVNELLKRVQITTPTLTNFLSPKAPTGNYASNELASSSSNLKTGSNLSVQIKESTYDKFGSSAILPRLPDNLISSGQSSDSLASSMYKGTPNSAQKALLSTLAFAAQYESLMNKGKSSGSSTFSKEDNREATKNESVGGSLQNDQAKASNLLNFLLGVGSKSNL